MPATKNKTKCPVCGMAVDQDSEFKADHKGQTYYFCSENDRKEFRKRPQVYAWKEHPSKAGKAA